ncbi:hypothetical protein J6P59_03715 [bacterium]|nr:hypothetical protein [bacterium]
MMLNIVENVSVLLPLIKIQNEIVNILDQFNDLTNSIFLGLPKEIELRQNNISIIKTNYLHLKN